MRFGLLSWGITSVALVNESQFHRLPGHLLYALSQLAHLCPVLLIGWGDQQRQQMTLHINGYMHLAAFAPLGSIIASMTNTHKAYGR